MALVWIKGLELVRSGFSLVHISIGLAFSKTKKEDLELKNVGDLCVRKQVLTIVFVST